MKNHGRRELFNAKSTRWSKLTASAPNAELFLYLGNQQQFSDSSRSTPLLSPKHLRRHHCVRMSATIIGTESVLHTKVG
jgi:hypothetical protein